jgi:hypothetical protein
MDMIDKYIIELGETLIATYYLNNIMGRYYSSDYTNVTIYEGNGDKIISNEIPGIIHDILISFKLYDTGPRKPKRKEKEYKSTDALDILVTSFNTDNVYSISYDINSMGTYIYDCYGNLIFQYGSWEDFAQQLLKNLKFKRKKYRPKKKIEKDPFYIRTSLSGTSFSLPGTTTSSWTTS